MSTGLTRCVSREEKLKRFNVGLISRFSRRPAVPKPVSRSGVEFSTSKEKLVDLNT